jgi:diguanylate cyclase (GGDEF)-like protein
MLALWPAGLGVVALATARYWVPAFDSEAAPGVVPSTPISLHVIAVMVLTISYLILAGTFASMYSKCRGLLGFRFIFLVFALFTAAAGVTQLLGLLGVVHRAFRYMEQLEMVSSTLAVVSAGIVAALVGRVRDFLVTMRQSQRNEARFIAASESSLEAFYTLQSVRGKDGEILDFEFTYINANGEKLIGLARERVLGQRLCELLPLNRTGGFFEKYKQVVMTGQPAVQEFPWDVEGEAPRWIRYEAVRLEDGIAITAADITERKLYLRAAEHRAQHDPLTGLANRSLLQDRMQQAIDRAVRYRHKVGLFVVDMDRFKEINDSLGHAAGDKVLIAVAQRLRESVRASDSVLRIGGDEFLVVVPDVQEERDLRRLAAKIVASVSRVGPSGLEDVSMGCSIGIAVYPLHAAGLEELLAHADAAMYEAKRRGGSCFEVYSHATPGFTAQTPAGRMAEPRAPETTPALVVPHRAKRSDAFPEA